jgi:hypothetical protein
MYYHNFNSWACVAVLRTIAELLAMQEKRESAAPAALASIDPNMDVMDSIEEEAGVEELFFSPERGNVLFASAVDGWGFRCALVFSSILPLSCISTYYSWL